MKRLFTIFFFATVFCLTSISGFSQTNQGEANAKEFAEALKEDIEGYKRVIKYKEPIVIPIIEKGYYGDTTARIKETGFHYCTVNEYYKNGELRLAGKIISADVGCTKLVGYDGQVIYYYRNGNIFKKESWQYGKKHGVTTYHEEGNGNEVLELREEYVKGEMIDTSKFSAPADSPITGTWKYIECYKNDCSVKDNGFYKTNPTIVRTSTYIYSQNGVVESIHRNSIDLTLGSKGTIIKGNWKYTPKSATTGVLEEYRGEELIERANVKFLNRNQLEYTTTFHQNSDLVGKQYVWTRQ